MGLIETIKKFFEGKEKGKLADMQLLLVEEAASSGNYNKAASVAFEAMVQMGTIYKGIEREPSTTAREYGKILEETGLITYEELEPIIYHFEVATYSEGKVTSDDYSKINSALQNTKIKLQSEGNKKSKGGRSKAGTRKRKPTKRKRTSTGKGKTTSSGKGSSPAARRRKARKK